MYTLLYTFNIISWQSRYTKNVGKWRIIKSIIIRKKKKITPFVECIVFIKIAYITMRLKYCITTLTGVSTGDLTYFFFI